MTLTEYRRLREAIYNWRLDKAAEVCRAGCEDIDRMSSDELLAEANLTGQKELDEFLKLWEIK